MRYWVIFLFLLVALTVKSQSLTVMTYNIRCGHCDDQNPNNWESRKELVLSVIEQHHPDIVGLQEVVPVQLDYLRSHLPGYSCYGTGRNADGTDEGCYIFYKKSVLAIDSTHSGTKWYSSTPDVPGSNDLGDLYRRIVTFARFKTVATGRYFYHFNTHLTYLDTLQVRYVDFLSAQIKNRAIEDNPFILTGDFNANESSPAIHRLKENFASEKLVDTYREIYPDGAISTFNSFTGKTDEGKIDYIFVEAELFRVIQAGCDTTNQNGKYPSDHYPINAVIRLK